MSGWTNIFMQLITGAGPVLGEGMLEGWQTSIELQSFGWTSQLKDEHDKEKKGGVGGAVASAAQGLTQKSPESSFDMGDLTFTKRFDVASAQIHTCLDNALPVLSASITVLHVKQGGRLVHEPG